MDTRTSGDSFFVCRLQSLFVVFYGVSVVVGIVGVSAEDLGGTEAATDTFDGEVPLGGLVGGVGHEEKTIDSISCGGSLFTNE
jgi:hypothetical protein